MILQEYTNENLYKKKILQEQYYGGNRLLKELDGIMDECVKVSREIMVSNTSFGIAKPNQLIRIKKHEKKIEKILKELFNFKEVNVTIESFGGMNAYTIERTGFLKQIDYLKGDTPKYNKEVGPYGIRFKKPIKSLEMHVGIELLGAPEMTGRIAVACMLHEVGHNFYIGDGWEATYAHISVLIQVLQLLATAPQQLIAMVPSLWLTSDNVKTFIVKLTNTIQEKFHTYDVCTRFCNSISNSLVFLAYSVTKILAGFTIIPSTIISTLLNVPRNLIFRDDYKNEQFADNFATSFGYGAETIKLQQILATTDTTWAEQKISKNKFMAMYFDAIKNINNMFQGFGDCHPGNMTRALDQVKYLEQNINYLPKENRKEIQAELDRAKKQLNIFKKACDDNLIAVGKTFTAQASKEQYRNGGELAYQLTQSRDDKGQWSALV